MFIYLVRLTSKDFYPSKSVKFQNINNCTDFNEINRLGKPSEIGSVTIEGNDIFDLNRIAKNLIESHVNLEFDTEFTVIRYYENQCNLEFSKEELEKVVEVGAVLNVTCSQDS